MAEFIGHPLTIPAVVALFVAIYISQSFKIAQDSERFALFLYGRFYRYKGPGLVLIVAPYMTTVKLGVGNIGLKLNDELVRFGDFDIPTTGLDEIQDGDPIRISRFGKDGPEFVASSIRPKQRCPKCGHEY